MIAQATSVLTPSNVNVFIIIVTAVYVFAWLAEKFTPFIQRARGENKTDEVSGR